MERIPTRGCHIPTEKSLAHVGNSLIPIRASLPPMENSSARVEKCQMRWKGIPPQRGNVSRR